MRANSRRQMRAESTITCGRSCRKEGEGAVLNYLSGKDEGRNARATCRARSPFPPPPPSGPHLVERVRDLSDQDVEQHDVAHDGPGVNHEQREARLLLILLARVKGDVACARQRAKGAGR